MRGGMVRRAIRSTPVQRMLEDFRHMPMLGRWAAGGATCLGIIGAVTGLVVGLFAYPLTAPFAMLELGLPSTIFGGAIGLITALTVMAMRRIWRRDRHLMCEAGSTLTRKKPDS